MHLAFTVFSHQLVIACHVNATYRNINTAWLVTSNTITRLTIRDRLYAKMRLVLYKNGRNESPSIKRLVFMQCTPIISRYASLISWTNCSTLLTVTALMFITMFTGIGSINIVMSLRLCLVGYWFYRRVSLMSEAWSQQGLLNPFYGKLEEQASHQ